jgi:hypothetical protein
MYTALLVLFCAGLIGSKYGEVDGMILIKCRLLLTKDSFLSANNEALTKSVFCEDKRFYEAAPEYISVLRECASGSYCLIN